MRRVEKESSFSMPKLCEHGRQKSRCKDCGGASVCIHGRQKYYCRDCGGSGVCKHGRRKRTCKDCVVDICDQEKQKLSYKDRGGSGANKCIGEYVKNDGEAVEVKSLEVSAEGSGGSSVSAVRRKATTANAKTLLKVHSEDIVSVLITDNANPSASTGESNDLESIFVMIV